MLAYVIFKETLQVSRFLTVYKSSDSWDSCFTVGGRLANLEGSCCCVLLSSVFVTAFGIVTVNTA